MDGQIEVSVLGPVEVRLDGVSVELPQGRSRALLAVLALGAGQVVSTARLIDELWGEPPPVTVVTALHGLVAGLRRRIEPDRATHDLPRVLLTRSPGYVLDVSPECVDAHRFRVLVGGAASLPAEDRARVLREALGIWRGPVLDGVSLAGQTLGEAAALEELRAAAFEDRIDADLALGCHRDVIGELESLIAEQPFRERLYGQLMLALYRSERQIDALDVWRRARDVLVEKVGVEPGPGLRRLHRAILEHDPALDLTVEGPDAGALDDAARDMVARAGELLAAAGSRVYELHYDAAAAEELFARAEMLLPDGHPQRDQVADRVSEIYLMLGRPSAADARLKQALAATRDRGDAHRRSHLLVERARIQLIVGPDPMTMDELGAVGRRALEEATEAGDDAVVSQACYVLGLIALRRGRVQEMEELARQALLAADRSGHPRERLAARWWLALALVEGPTPTDDAIAECERLVEVGPDEHLGVLTELARLHAFRGAYDVARDHIDRAVSNLQRRPGLRRPAMFISRRAGEIELAGDHPESAAAHLRTALALADELGEADERAQVAATLARVLVLLGETVEADALAGKSRHAAPRESVTAQALWRAATAAVRCASADGPGARELLDEAIALTPDEMVHLATDLHAQRTALP